MEIVNIEARTFETMMERFEQFAQSVDSLCQRHESRDLKEWLDSQDVCEILNVTKRTLQTLRDNGRLAYTMIARKVYYKPQDVQRLIENAYRKGVQHGKSV